ncbi:MAG: serine protease inhibitor 4 [Hyperionvirus sp.]|uniref:Serine protease inhibitor 4 n=1 Tax=Hyperionvirus sp. TaxID=2487770 RepID=A0A3G5AAS7_9VIRU|nr:MAG: serine protease inhibitor 4 [Hyperionvirus sp.]
MALYETKAAGTVAGDSVFTGVNRKFDKSRSCIFSPLSLEQALAVPYVGSDGDTKAVLANEFDKVVPKGVCPIDYYGDYLNPRLTATGDVSIGNAIWINNKSGFKANPSFAKRVEKLCRVEALPFDEKFQGIIDGFVNEKTKSMIKNGPMIDCSDPLLSVVVLNTLFLESAWKKSFVAAGKRKFTLGSGESIEHPMMSVSLGSCKYYEDENFCAVELEYKNDFAMVVILAKGESLALVDVSESKLAEVRREMKTRGVEVLMPKFSAESTLLLLKPLTELTSDKIVGPYEQMGTDPLKISAIIQQCKIDVDETGTRAAAATTILMTKECLFKAHPTLFHADKPFMYHIAHKEKVLFMGTYIGN